MANFYGSYIGYGAGGAGAAAYIYPKEGAGYVPTHVGIDRLSFASTTGSASEVGDMATGINTTGRYSCGSNSSATHAYFSGGYGPGEYTPNTADVIERMSFASKGTAVDCGDLVRHMNMQAGTSNETHGYLHCGIRAVNDPTGAAGAYSEISRFDFGSSVTSADIGNVLSGVDAGRTAGSSDIPNGYGYIAGGGSYNGASQYEPVTRYAMVSSADSVDVGDMEVSSQTRSGSSSETHGYSAGGYYWTAPSSVIEKYAFASSADGAQTGDLQSSGNYYFQSGLSSPAYGFGAGGGLASNENITTVNIYSHTSDADGTDWGDLSIASGYMASVGSQGSE